MKKKLLSLVLVVTMVCAMLTACGSSSSTSTSESKADKGIQAIKDAGKLKVGCKADVVNYGFLNTSTNAYEGFEIDLSYEIAGKIFGCTAEEAKSKGLVEFKGITAKTRGPLLDTGDIDMVCGTFTMTDERKKSWNFSTPYCQDSVGLMFLKTTGYTSIKDLDGAIIGVSQGSTSKDTFNNYIKAQGLNVTVTFQEFDSYPSINTALSSGNIDVFSTDRSILSSYMNDKTAFIPEIFGTQDYAVATSLGSTELTASVDSTVKELLSNGKMTTMLTKWKIQ